MTFADILRQRAIDQPDHIAFAVIDGECRETGRLTFGELYARARRVARSLIANDLTGKPVILALPSGLDFVVALFGCFVAGAIAVPIPDTIGKRTANRVAAIVEDVRPAGILSLKKRSDASALEALQHATPQPVWLCLDAISVIEDGLAPPKIDNNTLALVQYTSGSTSVPKGVMLSHDNLLANNAMIAHSFGHDQSLRGLGWLPLFHDMGLIGHVLQPMYVGGLSVLMDPLLFLQRPMRWLHAISRWKATTSGGPSYAYELCLRALLHGRQETLDLSSWTTAYCGAEPVRADVLERFSESFAPMGFRKQSYLPCYGLAEATLLVTAGKPQDGLRLARHKEPSLAQRQLVSCGSPPQGSLVIKDIAGPRVLPENEVGEIFVTGLSVAKGYWKREAETQKVFCEGTGGRFLRTGDLGFLSDGQLFVTGRLKDIIISLGSNHAAEDIEATVRQSESGFFDFPSAAFAFDVAGEEKAVVVQEVPSGNTDYVKLGHAVEKAFAAVTRNHGLRLFDIMLVKRGSIPRTSSGKIQRARARELYGQGQFVRLSGVISPSAAARCEPAAEAEARKCLRSNRKLQEW